MLQFHKCTQCIVNICTPHYLLSHLTPTGVPYPPSTSLCIHVVANTDFLQIAIAVVCLWLKWPCHIQKAPFHSFPPILPCLTIFLTLLLQCFLDFGTDDIDVLFKRQNSHLFSVLCSVMSLYTNYCLLQKEASLIKVEGSTNTEACSSSWSGSQDWEH